MQTVRAKPTRLSNAAKCLLNDYVHGGLSAKGNSNRGSLKWGPREAPLPNIWNNETKSIFYKRTIKVCISCC